LKSYDSVLVRTEEEELERIAKRKEKHRISNKIYYCKIKALMQKQDKSDDEKVKRYKNRIKKKQKENE